MNVTVAPSLLFFLVCFKCFPILSSSSLLCFPSFLIFLGVSSQARRFLFISFQNFFLTLKKEEEKKKERKDVTFLEPSFFYQVYLADSIF